MHFRPTCLNKYAVSIKGAKGDACGLRHRSISCPVGHKRTPGLLLHDGRRMYLPKGTHILLDVWHANRLEEFWGVEATGT